MSTHNMFWSSNFKYSHIEACMSKSEFWGWLSVDQQYLDIDIGGNCRLIFLFLKQKIVLSTH